MNFGFIGAGNMAGAIIKGMTKNEAYAPENIFAYDINEETLLRLLNETGINISKSADEVVEISDVIILAVKPDKLPEVLKKISDKAARKKLLVISIAVGKTIEYLEGFLGRNVPIARVMPNINAKVLAAASGFCLNSVSTDSHKEIVSGIFSAIGEAYEIKEEFFGIFGAIAGASPAFAYLYINALATAALKAGMPKKDALKFAAQTVLGSAKMVLEGGEHPSILIDQVCSPGGTTIEGICTLKEKGFENSVIAAVDAVIAKDKIISKG